MRRPSEVDSPYPQLPGKKKIMEQVVPVKIMHSGTYNANALCVAAAYASLSELDANDGRAYHHLNKVGNLLIEGLQNAVEKTKTQAIVQGLNGGGCQIYFTSERNTKLPRLFQSATTQLNLRFSKQLLKRGVYFHAQQYEHLFVSTVHTEEQVQIATESCQGRTSEFVKCANRSPVIRISIPRFEGQRLGKVKTSLHNERRVYSRSPK